MIAFVWNCRGIGQPKAVRILRNYLVSHRPDVVFLSAVKCTSEEKIKKIFSPLGFLTFEFVPAIGASGGLLLCWKSQITVRILMSNANLINCLILNDPPDTPWQFTVVYGPPVPSQRPVFWDQLWEIGQAFFGP